MVYFHRFLRPIRHIYTYMCVLIVSMNSAGHRWLLEVGSSAGDDATVVINSTALDGGKIQLIFCIDRSCPPVIERVTVAVL
jgi:hypothetical protein